jgi:hypothetical protein
MPEFLDYTFLVSINFVYLDKIVCDWLVTVKALACVAWRDNVYSRNHIVSYIVL